MHPASQDTMHLKSNVVHEVERETSAFVDLVDFFFFFPENMMDRVGAAGGGKSWAFTAAHPPGSETPLPPLHDSISFLGPPLPAGP